MDLLYMDDSYLKEFEATVEKVEQGKYVILNRTAFYPNGGGQPYDTGVLVRDDGERFNVIFVGKFGGVASHEVDHEGLKPGDKVKGIIDWDRRYKLMRSHTASHVISSVFHNDFGAKITGNQLSVEKIRIDFNLEDFDRDKIIAGIDKANELLQKSYPVSHYYLLREEALKDPSLVKLAGAMPPEVKELRIVQIGTEDEIIDRQADGGTHVKNTSEVGTIEFLKAENKGKNNRRVYVKLKD